MRQELIKSNVWRVTMFQCLIINISIDKKEIAVDGEINYQGLG